MEHAALARAVADHVGRRFERGRVGRGRDHERAHAAIARKPRQLAERVEPVGQRRVELDQIAEQPEVPGQRPCEPAFEDRERRLRGHRADDSQTDRPTDDRRNDVAARRLIHGALDANAISAPTHCSRQVSENSDTTGGTADSGLARGCAATPSNEPGDTLEA